MRGNPANRTTFVTEKKFRQDDLTRVLFIWE